MTTSEATPKRIDHATARALAVRAGVDPRSIFREIDEPGSVRGMAGHRARRVLAEAGLAAKEGRVARAPERSPNGEPQRTGPPPRAPASGAQDDRGATPVDDGGRDVVA